MTSFLRSTMSMKSEPVGSATRLALPRKLAAFAFTLLCAALNIHLNYVWNIRQDNTAVNILDYYEDRIMVSLMNDAHHIR